MTNSSRLALWIRSHAPSRPDPLTHLKLQKLAFYCYGAALASGQADELGEIEFEAWEHGPVCRGIWREYRDFGSRPIPPAASGSVTYSSATASVLADVLAVYGALDAWSLRQESHLEAPWLETWRRGGGRGNGIPRAKIREHFAVKFGGGAVAAPEYLSSASSFALDRIPVRGYASLHDLAKAISMRVEH